MNELLGNNLFYIYLFACLVVMNYSAFGKYQKIFIIYLITFGMNFLNLVGTRVSLVLLLSVLFIYEEYLNDDKGKLLIITRLRYKIVDFLYYAVFQYDILWILFALFLNSNMVQQAAESYSMYGMKGVYLKYISLVFFVIGLHRLSSQPFELNTFKNMMAHFEEFAFRYIPFEDDELMERLTLITEVEDKSFFARKKSYNWISREFVRYKYRTSGHGGEGGKRFRIRGIFRMFARIARDSQKALKLRGYSTIEMQLIKIIGLKRGHFPRKFVIRRKIYEIIYSTFFFKGLRQYYVSNKYSKEQNFKAFILYVYLYTVPTTVNGKYFDHFIDAFRLEDQTVEKKDWIRYLPLEGMFAACLGLNTRTVYYDRLMRYEWILDKHMMRMGLVLEAAWLMKQNGFLSVKSQTEDYKDYLWDIHHEFTVLLDGFENMTQAERSWLYEQLEERIGQDNFVAAVSDAPDGSQTGFYVKITFRDRWTTGDVNLYITRLMSELGYPRASLAWG